MNAVINNTNYKKPYQAIIEKKDFKEKEKESNFALTIDHFFPSPSKWTSTTDRKV